jgi:hypothetical protein
LVSLIENLAEFEIDSIFKDLDQRNKGSIPKEKFLQIFGYEEGDNMAGIEDILRPLLTVLTRKKLNLTDIMGNKQKISAADIQELFQKYIYISNDEVNTMGEFFIAKHKSVEIRKADFHGLLNANSVRKYNSQGAKESLKALMDHLSKSGSNIESILNRSKSPFPLEVTIGGFKREINSLACLTK